MKILILVGRFPQLSETFIFRQVVALAGRGHHITVAMRDPGDWTPFRASLPLPANVQTVVLAPDTRLGHPSRLLRAIRRVLSAAVTHPRQTMQLLQQCLSEHGHRPNAIRHFLRYVGFVGLETDIIHFEFLSQPAMYRLLPCILRVPYVVSCRGADLHLYASRSPETQAALRESLQEAAAVHVVSSEMAELASSVSGRQEGIWVNRPAVAVGDIQPRPPRSGDTPPLILATGRLVWKKGFDYLLAALAHLKAEGLAFQVRILGDGELRHALQFSILDLGIEDRVELCGAVPPPAVLAEMQKTDIFVLSSHEEGISNAVLEAMASGLPIVTTNAGGMAEAVRNGIEGFVVPVRDIEALAERIRQLLLDAPLRERMGKAARARAEAEFSLERQADVFEEIYSAALQQGHQP